MLEVFASNTGQKRKEKLSCFLIVQDTNQPCSRKWCGALVAKHNNMTTITIKQHEQVLALMEMNYKSAISHLFKSFRTSQHYLNNGNELRARQILEAGVAQMLSAELNTTLDDLAKNVLTMTDAEVSAKLSATNR